MSPAKIGFLSVGCMAAFETEFDFSKRSFVIVLNIIRDAAFMINNVQDAVINLVGNRMGYYNNFIVSTYYMNSKLLALQRTQSKAFRPTEQLFFVYNCNY